MKATFSYVVQYQVEGICVTPLRTGCGEDVQQVLRKKDGRLFVQGASLAGALKDWMNVHAKNQTAALLGDENGQGDMIVSDVLIDRKADTTLRPRLRIDGHTGTAADGAKFDMEHIEIGSKLSFTLTMLQKEQSDIQENTAEQMLAAMDQGDIRLGGQKSNGFGHISLKVKKISLNMKNDDHRKAWVEDDLQGTPLELTKVLFGQRVHFTVKAYADRVLVKSGAPNYEGEYSYQGHLEEAGKSVIPGSSIKGAVLCRARAIADSIGFTEETAKTLCDRAFGRINEEGDNGLPGQFYFEDAFLDKEKRQKIHRIRINKFTGGVLRQGLFTEEPLGGNIVLNISGPVDQPDACGLMLYALRDLGLGLYNIGSGGNIGWGYLKVREITVSSGEKTAALRFDGQGSCTTQDPDGLCREWLKELGGLKQ